MPLYIQTTGLEDYAPGGKARVKVLVIGGPGCGKTRWASYFPQPIYADCESGRASIADRKMAYVEVNCSQDMLDLLAHLKQECMQPAANRKYNTVVIDTLDAFQRKVKNEWMEINKKSVFTGWEAWGYLNSKMQLLMTRLLNLDMNVIVTVHYKDKTTTDDDTGKSTHTLMLQLQGELADTAFNDFDLVAWMGTYWAAENGERVQKRGLTFKPTPDKPMLKDRLHVTPDWLPVDFAPSDYTRLFESIQSRVADIDEGMIVGEVPSEQKNQPTSGFVVPPGVAGTGALPPVEPKDVPLTQLDKQSLIKRCRDAGITTIADGSPIRGNTLKAELITALEKADAASAAAPTQAPAPTEPAAASKNSQPAPTELTDSNFITYPTLLDSQSEKVALDASDKAVAKAVVPDPEPAAKPTEPDAPRLVLNAQVETLKEVPEGIVDTTTGEILSPVPTQADAVDLVKDKLGGVVIDDEGQAGQIPAKPTPQVPDAGVCEDCGKSLAEEKSDFVKLSWIKYRKRLCAMDYQKRKTGVSV